MPIRRWSTAIASCGPVLALAILGAGCTDRTKFHDSIAKFHDASAAVLASARTAYLGMNKAERDHYAEQRVTQRKPIGLDEMEKAQVIDSGETAVRLVSLDVLGKYGDLLLQLAGAPTAAGIQSNTADLQKELTTLSGQVDKLAADKNGRFQEQAKSMLPVLGSALQAVVDAKTVAALRKGLVDAVKPMSQFIGTLETDMRLAHAREGSFLSDRRTEAYKHYAADLQANAESAKLRADADSILLLENQWEAFESGRPIAGLEGMRHAYDALVEFARKPRPSTTDYIALMASVDSFVTAARQAGAAAQTQTPK